MLRLSSELGIDLNSRRLNIIVLSFQNRIVTVVLLQGSEFDRGISRIAYRVDNICLSHYFLATPSKDTEDPSSVASTQDTADCDRICCVYNRTATDSSGGTRRKVPGRRHWPFADRCPRPSMLAIASRRRGSPARGVGVRRPRTGTATSRTGRRWIASTCRGGPDSAAGPAAGPAAPEAAACTGAFCSARSRSRSSCCPRWYPSRGPSPRTPPCSSRGCPGAA